MGVASLILAIVSFVNIVLLIAVIWSARSTFQLSGREETPFNYFLGTWMVVIALIAVCGIVFGIGGVRQRNRRHSLAAAGLFLNIAVPLGIMFFLLLAESARAPIDGDSITESAPNQPAYRSPLAVDMQMLTGLLVASAGIVFWKRRQTPSATVESPSLDLIVCGTCRKQMPRASRFCRRCGSALHG